MRLPPPYRPPSQVQEDEQQEEERVDEEQAKGESLLIVQNWTAQVNIWSGSKPLIKVVLKPKCVLVLG